MAKAIKLLQERSEEEGEEGGLYYTPKQQRVLKAIVQNPEDNSNQIAKSADVHPSYVTYIIGRLPPEHATDMDWMREKAGLTEEKEMQAEEEEATAAEGTERARGMTAAPDDEAPPALSQEEAEAMQNGEAESVMQSFGLADGETGEEADGMTFTVVRKVPMQISFTIPDDVMSEAKMKTLANAKQKVEEIEA